MSASAPTSLPVRTNSRLTSRVIVKAVILFLVANLTFALVYPFEALGKLSIYNTIVPGRKRLPYAENPSRAYNVSLFNLDAMFASHEISGAPKPEDEYRVVLIGDSSTWGYLLPAEETLSASINRANLRLSDGRVARAYNLGYPVMSLAKDLLILSKATQYDPDLIVWLVTLESFPYDKQLSPPLIQHNPDLFGELMQQYGLRFPESDAEFVQVAPLEKTIVGSRKELADWLRLQIYGFLWSATGIDQDIPEQYPAKTEDLPADTGFHDLEPSHLDEGELAFDILRGGVELAAGAPVLIVNEPMYISKGENSDIRYNFYYPRWAYDQYRQLLTDNSAEHNWAYLDVWDTIPADEFTNTAIHLTPQGTKLLADQIGKAILALEGDQP